MDFSCALWSFKQQLALKNAELWNFYCSLTNVFVVWLFIYTFCIFLLVVSGKQYSLFLQLIKWYGSYHRSVSAVSDWSDLPDGVIRMGFLICGLGMWIDSFVTDLSAMKLDWLSSHKRQFLFLPSSFPTIPADSALFPRNFTYSELRIRKITDSLQPDNYWFPVSSHKLVNCGPV